MNIKDLYRQLIMDHYKNPQNKGLIKEDDYITVGVNNPSCGDEIAVQVKINGNIVEDIRHEGTGCSICCASASVASQLLKGKKVSEVNELINLFYDLMKEELPKEKEILLEDAAIFQGVAKFPARIKCATLSWLGIEKAINTNKEED